MKRSLVKLKGIVHKLKTQLFLLTFLLLIKAQSFSQINTPFGVFQPLSNISLTYLDYSFRDVGTNIYINEYFYSNTSYRISAVFRKNGYWFIVEDIYNGSYTNTNPNIGNRKILARSTYKNLTINPPCNSAWFAFVLNNSNYVSWPPPFSVIPDLN